MYVLHEHGGCFLHNHEYLCSAFESDDWELGILSDCKIHSPLTPMPSCVSSLSFNR